MTTNQIYPRDSQLYVGGVPATVLLQQTRMPVRTSLVGGFSKLAINGRSVTNLHSWCYPANLFLLIKCFVYIQVHNVVYRGAVA